ncbi:hypothetical protein NMY22_g4910 [Coprinellus aureogranulatus]|nr:hypothetical protein NMY22_g4910 [Coprinellus aureogranulatus]
MADELASIDGIAPAVLMAEGEEREVGSATSKSTYKIKRHPTHYFCSCPAWRNQKGVAVNARTCKHLKAFLGDAYENARVVKAGGEVKEPAGGSKGKAKPASKAKAEPKAKPASKVKPANDDEEEDGQEEEDAEPPAKRARTARGAKATSTTKAKAKAPVKEEPIEEEPSEDAEEGDGEVMDVDADPNDKDLHLSRTIRPTTTHYAWMQANDRTLLLGLRLHYGSSIASLYSWFHDLQRHPACQAVALVVGDWAVSQRCAILRRDPALGNAIIPNVPAWAITYANLLGPLQHTMESILCSRVMFVILKRRKTMDRRDSDSVDADGLTGIFTSVMDAHMTAGSSAIELESTVGKSNTKQSSVALP